MPRAVSPWTWGKALRDHGPSDRDFLCAMLILRTYMDQDGFAYPSLRTWATGVARMSVNTLRKHVAAAAASGWLNVESRAGQRRERVRNVYRCTIPDHVRIDGADEQIADAITARNGDVDERLSVSFTERVRRPFADPSKGLCPSDSVSTLRDTDELTGAAAVSPKSDTDSQNAATEAARFPAETAAFPQDANSVSDTPPICVNAASHLYQNGGSSVSPMIDTEVLKSPEGSSYEGASALAHTSQQTSDEHLMREARHQKARKMIQAAPTTDDRRVASMYGLAVDDIRRIRAEIAQEA